MTAAAAKRRLLQVGGAAIRVRYPTEADLVADPAGAMLVAMDAMRATLGLAKPVTKEETMTDDTTDARDLDRFTKPDPAADTPRKGRHIFTVNAGRDMLEFEVDADDFEVAGEGVHFVRNADTDQAVVCAFVSHPCIVRQDDDR